MFNILAYNKIPAEGLSWLPREKYSITPECAHPDAILLRSFNLHDVPIPETVLAVGRAGSGVNNIPVEAYSKRGIPVFNAPGANADAVKELTIAGMLLASRNITAAWDYARGLKGDDAAVQQQVEKEKKRFDGLLDDKTRLIIDSRCLDLMKQGAILINFSRAGVVDETALCAALHSGKLRAYVTDFPTSAILDQPRAIALPHLGATTDEAEVNSTRMVAESLTDFLENGEIRHSVNFPEVVMPRGNGVRLAVANENVPGMVSQITAALAAAGLNIEDLLNKARDKYAYTLIGLKADVPPKTLQLIRSIKGVLSARIILGAENKI
jgi:hypothetical protein